MNKILLTAAASVIALTSTAKVDFSHDLYKRFSTTPGNLDGWVFHSPDATPSGSFSHFFDSYSSTAPYSLYPMDDGSCLLLTPSEFKEDITSDTWVISPSFTITNDEEMISFNVAVAGMTSAVTNSYSVYISETGTAIQDFTLIEEGSLKGSANGANYLNVASKRISLKGYKGKKVHLALVNHGNSKGFMGFYDIDCASWYNTVSAANSYQTRILDADAPSLTFNFDASTPVTAQKFKVRFTTSGGFVHESEQRATTRLIIVRSCEISIPDITMNADIESYTLEVTPIYDGAATLTISGNIINGHRQFDNVTVFEEATGQWCGWCPFGAAALDMYTEKYNGDGNGKVIGIAMHGGSSTEPMMISSTVSDYYTGFMTDKADLVPGYPTVVINRATASDPRQLDMNTIMSKKNFIQAKLNKVYYNPAESNAMWANFDVTTSFTADTPGLCVSAIIVEDGVTGTGNSYNQSTFVKAGGYTADVIAQTFGAEWVPYLQLYLDEDVNGIIPASKMTYNHVARAAYPRYEGMEMGGSFVAGEARTGEFEFVMPANVKNPENTRVVLLVCKRFSNEILAADEMSYNEFTATTGIDATAQDNSFDASIAEGRLTVTSDHAGTMSVYGIDGTLRRSADFAAGTSTFDLDATSGLMIVKITSNGITKTIKSIR